MGEGSGSGSAVLTVVADAAPASGSHLPGDAGAATQQVIAQLDMQCAADDLEACRNLGVLFSEGVGVAIEPRRAQALFAKACNGKNLASCNHLALLLAEGRAITRDLSKAVAIFVETCEAGYGLACRNLGLLLRDGRGTPPDLARAATFLDRACTLGAPYACTNAGDLDALLASKAADAAAAAPHAKAMLAHYQHGCSSKEASACRQIGVAYLRGAGVRASEPAAIVWLVKACELGDADACKLIGKGPAAGAGSAGSGTAAGSADASAPPAPSVSRGAGGSDSAGSGADAAGGSGVGAPGDLSGATPDARQ